MVVSSGKTKAAADMTNRPDSKYAKFHFVKIPGCRSVSIREINWLKAALTAVRAHGRKGGRKSAINEEQIEQARAMIDNPKLKIKSIIKTLEITKATLYKYVPMGKSAVSEVKNKYNALAWSADAFIREHERKPSGANARSHNCNFHGGGHNPRFVSQANINKYSICRTRATNMQT